MGKFENSYLALQSIERGKNVASLPGRKKAGCLEESKWRDSLLNAVSADTGFKHPLP